MNEVEKMYRNVLGYVCNMPDVACFHECEKCDSYITFTAEKQLELIKWLINKGQFRIERCLNKYYFEFRDYDLHTRKYFTQMTFLTLEEGVSFVINSLWQDLTEEEQNEIKNILESEVRE